MKRKKRITIIVAAAALVLTAAYIVTVRLLDRDMTNRETLRVVTTKTNIGFYVSDGVYKGFQFELLKTFADSCGLKLHVTLDNNLERNINGVHDGEYDLLLRALPTTLHLKDKMDFVTPLYNSRLVLVQVGPKKKKSTKKEKKQEKHHFIRDILELENEKIYLEWHSVYRQQLEFIKEETGIWFDIEEKSGTNNEILATWLANGRIDYFACDEMSARMFVKHYPQFDIQFALGFDQAMAWGIAKGDDELKQQLDSFLSAYIHTKEYQTLYKKYFPY